MKRVGNTLDADTFLPVIQKNTAAAVVVAALMHQFTHPAVLRIIHHRNLIVDKNTSFLTVKISLYYTVYFWGKMTGAFCKIHKKFIITAYG